MRKATFALAAALATLAALAARAQLSQDAVTASNSAVAPSSYVSGNWYNPMPQSRQGAGAAATADTVFCSFGYVTKNVVVASLGINISATATGNAQLAIYSVSGGTLTFVDSTGNIDTSSGTAKSAMLANAMDTLNAGVLYAFCSNNSGTPTLDSVATTGAGYGPD